VVVDSYVFDLEIAFCVQRYHEKTEGMTTNVSFFWENVSFYVCLLKKRITFAPE
jgi:hypothetical protein